MKVEVVLTEADIAQEFAEAIEARDLPEKFFFWFPARRRSGPRSASTRSYMAVCGRPGRRSLPTAPELATHFGGRVPVISFGAGDGARDRLLMGALKNAGASASISRWTPARPCSKWPAPGPTTKISKPSGIKADISSPVHLVYAADAAEPPRLFILSGNTMGSFDPLAEIRYVAQCMKPEDRLIIDGEIHDAEKTMARRDNPAARKFLAAAAGLAWASRIPTARSASTRKRDAPRGTAPDHALLPRGDAIFRPPSPAEEIPLERGERIGMNFQYAYTPEAFRWLLPRTRRPGNPPGIPQPRRALPDRHLPQVSSRRAAFQSAMTPFMGAFLPSLAT